MKDKLERMALAAKESGADINCPVIKWIDWGNYWGCKLQEKDCSSNYCANLFPNQKGKAMVFLPCDCNSCITCSRYKTFLEKD